MRQILVYGSNKDSHRILEVPDDVKITVGPMSPGNRDFTRTLRIYKGKEHQYACLPGVIGFRDLSIKSYLVSYNQTLDEYHKGDEMDLNDDAKRTCVAANEHSTPYDAAIPF